LTIAEHLTGLERVQVAIDRLGLNATIVHPGRPMPTVTLAAEAVGCAPDQIIKTVVFLDERGSTVVAIASGTGRIDRNRLAIAVGAAKVKLASAEAVLERTGYPAGGVSPIGIRDLHARYVVDIAVLEQSEVYGGAGTEDDLLLLSVRDLLRISAGLVAAIADSPPTSQVADT
jgi:Cys-tRNA(Pro) deacylase